MALGQCAANGPLDFLLGFYDTLVPQGHTPPVARAGYVRGFVITNDAAAVCEGPRGCLLTPDG
jgi:hypothetical protein